MSAFELSCVAILAAAAALRALGPDPRRFFADAVPVAVAAWAAEDSCVRLYGFYGYSDRWLATLDVTPVLVPAIWVFVVLAARDVARALSPRAVLPVVFVLVALDGAFIEPIAVRAGLWSWSVPGPLGVPLVGPVGWACFAASAIAALERLGGWRRWAVVLVAPAASHALWWLAWWSLFRWLPVFADEWAVGLALVLNLGVVGWLVHAGRARTVPLWPTASRFAPAGLFFALLWQAQAPRVLWLHSLAFALPWLVMTRWRWRG